MLAFTRFFLVLGGLLALSLIPLFGQTSPQQSLQEAKGHVDEAGRLFQQRRFPEAESLFRKALAIYEKVLGDEHLQTAAISNNLGVMLSEQDKFAEAEPFHRKALAIRVKSLGEGNLGTGNTLHNLAYDLFGQGKLQEAEELERKALDIFSKALGDRHPQTATAFNNLGEILREAGKPVPAEEAHTKALAICRAVSPDPDKNPLTATCINNLGLDVHQQGRFTEAEKLHRQALELRVKLFGESHGLIAITHSNLGADLWAQGQYAESELFHRKAVRLLVKLHGENSKLTAKGFNNLAACLRQQGNFAEAEQLDDKALKARLQLLGEKHPETASSLISLALNYSQQGQHDKAESLCRKAVSIFTECRGEMHSDTATALNQLAGVLFDQDKFADAEAAGRRALSIYVQLLGEDHPHTASIHHTLGMCLQFQGKVAEAEKLHQKALIVRRRILGEDHPVTANSYGQVVFSVWFRGDYREAERMAQGTAKSFQAARLRASYTGLGRAEFASVRSPLEFLAALLARNGKPADAWKYREQHLGRALFDDLSAQHARKLSVEELQQEETIQGKLAFIDKRLPELLPTKKQQKEEADKLRKERDQLVLELVRHQATLQKKYGVAAGAVYDLERIQKQLAKDTALVAWLDIDGQPTAKDPNGEHWGIVVRHKGDPIWVRLPSRDSEGKWSEKDDKLPVEIRAILSKANPETVWEDAMADLAKQRLRPLQEHLEGIRHLVVLPSERMAGIPIEALTDKYHISYAPSATVYAWLRENRNELAGNSLLAVGASAFSAEQAKAAGPKGIEVTLRGERFGPLVGTQHEVQAIAKTFTAKGNKVQALLGPDAVLSKLEGLASEKKLDQFRYIHLATHGKALPQNGLSSFLTLTSEDYALMDYGKLSAGQIMKTWKLNADLVTLSACQTALGQKQGGEGYLGFSQALLLSGSRSLVLSQWSVSDHAASLLMIRFYQNLLGQRDGLKQPLSKLEALEEARRWLRDLPREEAVKMLEGTPAEFLEKMPRGERPFAHPNFWAAFVLIGDPGR